MLPKCMSQSSLLSNGSFTARLVKGQWLQKGPGHPRPQDFGSLLGGGVLMQTPSPKTFWMHLAASSVLPLAALLPRGQALSNTGSALASLLLAWRGK